MCLSVSVCDVESTGYRVQGGNVTSAGWQVTLCDPMWHASSRSGVATLRTAITCYLLTYLQVGPQVCVCVVDDVSVCLCVTLRVRAGS